MVTTICGSFRKDTAGLQQLYSQLVDCGYSIISPTSIEFVDHTDDFARTNNEIGESIIDIENRHLAAIRQSDVVWLHCPEGYVGSSAAMEIGVAISFSIPLYALQRPVDHTIAQYVTVVDAVSDVAPIKTIPAAPLATLQQYYAQRAQERGFGDESARDTVLLMTEELGELARAVRKHAGIARWNPQEENIAGELADVQLYLLHLANIVEVDLHTAVVEKEQHNEARYNAPKQ